MKKRIMWIGFAITAIALIVFSVISAEIYYDNDIIYSQRYLRAYMAAFDDSRTADALDEAYAKELSEALGGARVTFLTAEGEYIADSEDGDEASRAMRPEVRDAIASGEGFDTRVSQTLGDTFIYYCRRFDGYLVRIAERTQSMWSIYLDALPAVAIFLAADAVVCLLLSYLSTGFILKPLEQLAKDAAREKRVKPTVPELEPFAQLINRMNEDAEQRVQEIAEEREQVVRAQQSKDEFIANVTHEMNTPLTSIRGFSELLASGGLDAERARRAAQTILTQSERLQSLVASIINYSEIDSEDLPVYEVDASRIARETLAALTPEFREKKVVLLSEIKDGVMLLSRQERVTEIFGNIIRNAIRYNREGGSVSVLLTQEEFAVSDTGIGISEENLERIFDRFFTVDKSHNGKNGGFGLGLSVVKKLCKKQGWKLTVESKEGAGSTFRIAFAQEAAPEPQK
ncbi:MAG TPA: HAMP domain-containing histidine kinase [Firmicutes bacterium]|nr:HAMP domain-containing histidine kinase [Bacillota bacterium]